MVFSHFLATGRSLIAIGLSLLALTSCGQENVTESHSRDVVDSSKPSGLELSGGVDVASSDPLTKTVVSVQTTSGNICSGAMITKDWVLTAAHCVRVNDITVNPANLRVRFNETNVQNGIGSAGLLVSEVIPRPDYQILDIPSGGQWASHDIALIRLRTPIQNAIPASIGDQAGPGNFLLTSFFNIGSSRFVVDLAGFGFLSASNRTSFGILRKGRGTYVGLSEFRGSKLLTASSSTALPGEAATLLGGDSGGAWFFPRELNKDRLIIAGVSSLSDTVNSLAEPVGDHKDWILSKVPAAQFVSPGIFIPPTPPTCSISVISGTVNGRIPQSGGTLQFGVTTPCSRCVTQSPSGSVGANNSSSPKEQPFRATVKDPSTNLSGFCSISVLQEGLPPPPTVAGAQCGVGFPACGQDFVCLNAANQGQGLGAGPFFCKERGKAGAQCGVGFPACGQDLPCLNNANQGQGLGAGPFFCKERGKVGAQCGVGFPVCAQNLSCLNAVCK